MFNATSNLHNIVPDKKLKGDKKQEFIVILNSCRPSVAIKKSELLPVRNLINYNSESWLCVE